MPVYTVGVRTEVPGGNAAYLDVRTPAGGTTRARIREIGGTLVSATASGIGLIRPATVGTVSTSATVLPHDPADKAGTVVVGTAWSVAPTIGAVFLRRAQLPAVIGAGFVWAWTADAPLIVPANSTVLLWNFGGGGASALDAWVVLEE